MSGASASPDALREALAGFPRARFTPYLTPLEPAPNLAAAAGGPEIWIKRDDLAGLAFGGNKTRQLEFHFGEAAARGADTILITGAVQSNYARLAATAARKLGMQPVIQLEERVPDVGDLHRTNGAVLVDRLLGARLLSYPEGEDEAGADARLAGVADALRREGRAPYVIPLGPGHAPLGALGYVDAACELAEQAREQDLDFAHVVVGSGSAATHAGLLAGLRALGIGWPVLGACVRRPAQAQAARVLDQARAVESLLGWPPRVSADDVTTDDAALAPGYGRLNPATRRALSLAAETEGLILDPVYTAKAMAVLLARAPDWRAGGPVLFVHTGGAPALFAYADQM